MKRFIVSLSEMHPSVTTLISVILAEFELHYFDAVHDRTVLL
jgi:hypothetical protein